MRSSGNAALLDQMREARPRIRVDPGLARLPLASAVTPVVEQQHVHALLDEGGGVGQAVRRVPGVAVQEEQSARRAFGRQPEGVDAYAVLGLEEHVLAFEAHLFGSEIGARRGLEDQLVHESGKHGEPPDQQRSEQPQVHVPHLPKLAGLGWFEQ